MHVQMKFWKFENCTFCEITSSNVHMDFASNLQNRCSFIQMILMRGTIPMLTPKLHMSEIWSELKKWNMSLNFWVNIGMWPVVSMCNSWCLTQPWCQNIYDLYGLKAHSNDILSNNFCHVHLTISKIGCHRLTQQCWHACTNKILETLKKLYMFCEITSSNVHRFSSNLQNRCSFIQMILMRGKIPMLTLKLHMSEIWSELKKQNILLNFWVNIGMWAVISVWLSDAWHKCDVRVYHLYGLKALSNVLSNNFCHVHVTIFKIGCHRLPQQCNDMHVQMKFWKFENCPCFVTQLHQMCTDFLQTFRTDVLLSRWF